MGVLHNAASWSRPGDATLTAAILDCLAMHAIRTDIDGPSYRQHIAGAAPPRSAPPYRPW